MVPSVIDSPIDGTSIVTGSPKGLDSAAGAAAAGSEAAAAGSAAAAEPPVVIVNRGCPT